MIPIGKFSFLVLNVDMNPAKVDVNVHPAKLEVRFEEESTVFKAVYHAIKDALLKAELVADTENSTSETRAESGLFGTRNTTGYRNTYTSQMPSVEKSQDILRQLQEMKQRLINEGTTTTSTMSAASTVRC